MMDFAHPIRQAFIRRMDIERREFERAEMRRFWRDLVLFVAMVAIMALTQ